MLLLTEQSKITELHEYAKGCKYRMTYPGPSVRASKQAMKIANHTLTCYANSDRLLATISEAVKVLTSKPAKPTVRPAPLPQFIESRPKTNKNGYRLPGVAQYETVYRPCLCGVEWLKQHEHDVIPEPTIDLLIDGKELHVNGNYKQGIIKEFIKGH